MKSTGGHFALRNKKFEFLDPISYLKFSIIIISRLKETKYSEYDFCYNEFIKMAAILKSGGHFESENIKFGFLDPKTLEMCYYMTIYNNRGEFCAIFYFSVFLAAILAAILDFSKGSRAPAWHPLVL